VLETGHLTPLRPPTVTTVTSCWLIPSRPVTAVTDDLLPHTDNGITGTSQHN